MRTNYDFFEQTLTDCRVYRFHGERAAYEFQRLLRSGVIDELEIKGDTEGEEADFTVAGSHVMNASARVGVATINERFNITLPPDFDEFYRRWDGGLLLLRDVYPLLSVQQIVAQTLRYQETPLEESGSSIHLVRFCDLGNGDFLALRRSSGGIWEVVYKPSEYPDSFFMENWSEFAPRCRLDSGFSSWLARMIKTDGWPRGGENVEADEDVPPAQRIG